MHALDVFAVFSHQSLPPCLPLAPLQSEVAEQNRGEQKRHHRHGERRAFQPSAGMPRWKAGVAIRCVALRGPPRVST